MTTRRSIGICIGRDAVDVVRIERRAVASRASERAGNGVETSDVLRRCLAAVRPKTAWPRINCHVTFEPSLVQLKKLDEMPILTSARERLAMLEMVAGEHFLGSVGTLALVPGEQDASGSTWVFAVDRALLSSIEHEVKAAGFVLHGLTPVIDLLAATAVEDVRAVQRVESGEIAAFGMVESGRLSGAWRMATRSIAGGTLEIDSHLDAVTPVSAVCELFDAAHAAALAPSRSRFSALTYRAMGPRRRLASLWTLVAIAACLTLASFLAPGLRARHEANRAVAEIEKLAPLVTDAAARRRSADSLVRLQNQVAQFRSSGVRSLQTLAALGELLPNESYITALTMDSVSAQATFAALSATELLQSFAASSAFDSATLIGAVSRDPLTPGMISPGTMAPSRAEGFGRSIERISLRFVPHRTHAMATTSAREIVTSERISGPIAYRVAPKPPRE